MPSPPDQSKQQFSIASRKPRKERLVWPRPCRYSAWENRKRLLKRLFLFPPRKRPSLRELPTSSTAAKRPNKLSGGRHTGQPVNSIVADIVRINDGDLVEHWEVIQDVATREQSKSGQPMFGDTFAPQP